MPDPSSIVTLVQALALAALLSLSLGLVSRITPSAMLRDAIMGGLFGFATMMSMAAPIAFVDGIIVDLRNLFIAVSFGYFGWVGGAMTLGLSVGARIGIGGDGMLLGTIAMFVAAGLGAVWRAQIAERVESELTAGLILGGLLSLTIGMFLLLPGHLRFDVLMTMGPVLLVLYPLGAVVLTALLGREYRIIEEGRDLARQAGTDPLTNLPNRRRTLAFVEQMSRRGPSRPGVAMLYFDIDKFKEINDRHGHMLGDEVLREVTARVNACLRGDDHLARHGGDEFVVIQSGLSAEDALATAERCRAAVAAEPVTRDGQSIEVTISIGLHWSAERLPFAKLLQKADEALYRAKAAGRNQVGVLPVAA